MCFFSPQLPLDGSNMKPQTPQVCGVAMQGGREALNPILGTKLGPAIPGRDVTVCVSSIGIAQEVPPAQALL